MIRFIVKFLFSIIGAILLGAAAYVGFGGPLSLPSERVLIPVQQVGERKNIDIPLDVTPSFKVSDGRLKAFIDISEVRNETMAAISQVVQPPGYHKVDSGIYFHRAKNLKITPFNTDKVTGFKVAGTFVVEIKRGLNTTLTEAFTATFHVTVRNRRDIVLYHDYLDIKGSPSWVDKELRSDDIIFNPVAELPCDIDAGIDRFKTKTTTSGLWAIDVYLDADPNLVFDCAKDQIMSN